MGWQKGKGGKSAVMDLAAIAAMMNVAANPVFQNMQFQSLGGKTGGGWWPDGKGKGQKADGQGKGSKGKGNKATNPNKDQPKVCPPANAVGKQTTFTANVATETKNVARVGKLGI